MKRTLILCALILAGCADQAAPNYIAGHYYLAGDKSCKRYRLLSNTRIMCLDSNGIDMGYRDAMSTADMQVWQYRQQVEAQQMQSLNEQLQATNTQLSATTSQMLNQTRQYMPPPVAPIRQPGTDVVRCISTDIYTNCRY